MRINDIEAHLINLKDNALIALGIDAEVAQQIPLAAPPQPEMGDRGFPCFALARQLRKSPAIIAQEVADQIRSTLQDDPLLQEVSTAGPYVNFRLDPGALANLVVSQALDDGANFGIHTEKADHWMVEFSAPNTNKPQHLGHVRNNLLGDSVSRILDAAGHKITRVNLINDRGVHICKSMLAYERFGNGETPESTGIKGDHLVGKYYVLFNQKYEEEYAAWKTTPVADERYQEWLQSADSKGAKKELKDDEDALKYRFFSLYQDKYFNTESELGAAVRQMLREWEDGDPQVVALWSKMNGWVFKGFDETYENLGIHFDHVYLESQTYKLGKEIVEKGLEDGKFRRLDDGAIVCDLEPLGLQGQKVLLRGDGTSVYTTQDIGTAIVRFDDYDLDRMIYVVGDEQRHHFDVLFRILGFLRPELKDRLYHLSYGMVELPEGRMKSREGTVVDADDLLEEMIDLARQAVRERYDDIPKDEQEERARVIGLAALKYFILDFAPRTTVQFDPKRSIDFQGRTGPYCLYSYARISSIAERVGGWPTLNEDARKQALSTLSTELELGLVRLLQDWPRTVEQAAEQLSPARITEYLFNLCKAFSSFYNDPEHRIVDIEGPRKQALLLLSQAVQITIGQGLALLGIPTLEKM